MERAYQFSGKQYDRMVEGGIINLDTGPELIEGWLVQRDLPNQTCIKAFHRLAKPLRLWSSDDWTWMVVAPIALRHNRVHADFVFVREPSEQYERRNPRPKDIGLIIEVADASILTNRRGKVPLYAGAKIPELWLLNLVDSIVEVYTQPKGGKAPTYQRRRDYRQDEQVPLVLDGREVARLAVSTLCPVKVRRPTQRTRKKT
jgi:hypothetical protein